MRRPHQRSGCRVRKQLRLRRRIEQRIDRGSGDDGPYDRKKQTDKEPDGFHAASLPEINVQRYQDQYRQNAVELGSFDKRDRLHGFLAVNPFTSPTSSVAGFLRVNRLIMIVTTKQISHAHHARQKFAAMSLAEDDSVIEAGLIH